MSIFFSSCWFISGELNKVDSLISSRSPIKGLHQDSNGSGAISSVGRGQVLTLVLRRRPHIRVTPTTAFLLSSTVLIILTKITVKKKKSLVSARTHKKWLLLSGEFQPEKGGGQLSSKGSRDPTSQSRRQGKGKQHAL